MRTSPAVLFIVLANAYFLQAQAPLPTNSPTPTATKSRPSLDQFDLPNGIQLSNGTSTAADLSVAGRQVVVEVVSIDTYEGVQKLLEYSQGAERAIRSNWGMKQNPSDFYAPETVLKRNISAINRVIETLRTGLFGQRITNTENLRLLRENLGILGDVQAVLTAMPNGQEETSYTGTLKLLADRYGAQPPYGTTTDMIVEKRMLISAMMGRLNRNFTLLLSQLSVGNGK
jgi:hypothetical protein